MAAVERLIVFQSWKTNAKLTQQWLFWVSFLAVLAGMVLTHFGIGPFRQEDNGSVVRVIETVIPLTVGVLSALLFSPESEPSLEILLSCRRPIVWVLIERLVYVFILEVGIALLGNIITHGLGWAGEEPFSLSVLRWLAPLLFLSGVAVYGTQITRQGMYGMLLVTLMWGGMFLGGNPLLRKWPFLWPIHLYLQPEVVPIQLYFWNRAFAFLSGFVLIALAAYLTSNEERLLGLKGGR